MANLGYPDVAWIYCNVSDRRTGPILEDARDCCNNIILYCVWVSVYTDNII